MGTYYEGAEQQVDTRTTDNDAMGMTWFQDKDNFYGHVLSHQEDACGIFKVHGGNHVEFEGGLVRPCPAMYSTTGSSFRHNLRFDRINATAVRLRLLSGTTLLVDVTDYNAIPGSYTPGLMTAACTNLQFDNLHVWERSASCSNGVLDGDERFIDCGGPC